MEHQTLLGLLIDIRDHEGERTGVLGLSYMNVRPGLVSLLARGDEAMYERMGFEYVRPKGLKNCVMRIVVTPR